MSPGRSQAADPEPFRGSNFVWSDQYGARIQFVGIATGDVVVVDGALGHERYVAWYREGDRLVGALAVNAPRELMRSRKLDRGRGDVSTRRSTGWWSRPTDADRVRRLITLERR